jgi:hypothetical protein
MTEVKIESPADAATRAADAAFRERYPVNDHRPELEARRADRERQITEAEDEHRRAQWAVRDAEKAIQPARRRLKAFDAAHRGRVDDAHAALDRARERAAEQIRAKLVNSAANLATAGQPDSGAVLDLAPLAGAWAAASPEFTAAMHRLLDELVDAGEVPLSRLTADEIAAAREPLRAEVKAAEAALNAARETAAKAARWLTYLKTGNASRN